MSFLLGIIGRVGLKGALAGGGILLAVSLLVGQSVRLGHAQRDAKSLRTDVAVCEAKIVKVTAERDEAVAAIRTQNAAIERLKAEADAATAKGKEAAERALAAGRVRRDKHREPGHDEMNVWLGELFKPAQP